MVSQLLYLISQHTNWLSKTNVSHTCNTELKIICKCLTKRYLYQPWLTRNKSLQTLLTTETSFILTENSPQNMKW